MRLCDVHQPSSRYPRMLSRAALPFLCAAAVSLPSTTRTAAAGASAADERPARPHLLLLLHDDAGHHEYGWTNPDRIGVTGNLTALARGGIILRRHLVHYHCSPVRRQPAPPPLASVCCRAHTLW